jgi:hypothetical protein
MANNRRPQATKMRGNKKTDPNRPEKRIKGCSVSRNPKYRNVWSD